ncbi:uncharacterized protein LOC112576956 [Pomacea canaliculata]|uniref:uncharacterized protein LOC112576956 n=1 Tax=Pomacea canaliculata TaxID=400727 RepID=UPI000D7352E6|nr:uncharacterized protein LOC112576956 [Pomacea canaliculata]
MTSHDPCNSSSSANQSDQMGPEEADDYNKALAAAVKHYAMDLGIPLVAALGLIGNFMALVVLTKEKLHRSLSKMEISAHIGLIALAVSDLLFCLLVLLVTTLPLKKYYEAGEWLLYYNVVSGGLITVFIICSTWLIVVMAAERYVAVCHPLKARNLITLRRTRAYVITLFVVCPLCTIPVFLETSIETTECPDGRTLYHLGRAPKDSVALRRAVWAFCFDFLPCVALVYFNTCLIWKIHKAKQLREKMAPLQSRASFSSSSVKSGTRWFRWECNKKKSPTSPGAQSGKRKVLVCMDKNGRNVKGVQMHDLLDSSGSHEQSQSNANSADPAREMQLLCKENGNCQLVPSSPRYQLSTTNTSNSRQSRSFKSRRRFSDNALNSVTATLVAVVLTFLILVSPWELLKFGLQHSSIDQNKMDIALNLTNFMQVLNFSFNFVLYCLVNKSFRRTLRSICCYHCEE